MTIEELERGLVGKRFFVGGAWNSDGVVSTVKVVDFEGEACVFLYESEHPDRLWCWFPLKEAEALIGGGISHGFKPERMFIHIK